MILPPEQKPGTRVKAHNESADSRMVAALGRCRKSRVLFQILAAHHLAEALPTRVCGAARIDEDVIVRPFGLAFEDFAGGIAEHDAVAVALARLVGEKLAGVGNVLNFEIIQIYQGAPEGNGRRVVTTWGPFFGVVGLSSADFACRLCAGALAPGRKSQPRQPAVPGAHALSSRSRCRRPMINLLGVALCLLP